ncbi:MAG: response regulator [Myxococcota bacterium]
MSLDVLVVDDSPVMRRMVRRNLDLTGFELGEVREAKNGRDALDKLTEASVDLALVDVNMPVMNGIELIHAMKADENLSAVPVVVVSSEASAQRREQFDALGVGYVRKPFTPEDLVEAVIGALSGGENGTAGPTLAGSGPDF